VAPNAKSANAVNWDGSPLTLAVNASAQMAQTPNGSVIFTWQNMAAVNNDGTLAVTVGGAPPKMLDAPALITAPSFWVNNFQGSNVNVANVSVRPPTPIRIQMYGPGMPGITPQTLSVGTALSLAPGEVALGMVQPNLRLILQATAGNVSTIALLGGPLDPSGNNGYVFGLNMPSTPPNYTKTTPGNDLEFGPFNWGSSPVFVANLSPENAGPVSVLLQAL
jgi:hypothetical protein